ncbi:MAG: ABC transporter ATP-binding protein [Halobacteriales archaeon]|nr:ABC transporter ATP-binding protein [Halobacteriales archaeon]
MSDTLTSTADARADNDQELLLEMEDLHVEFDTYRGTVYALDGVDLDIRAGETVGLVGETGCGKTVTARSILGLVEDPGHVTAGSIRYKGTDLLDLPDEEMRDIRGSDISMVFQEPTKSLNPAFTVEQQLTSIITHHLDVGQAEARSRAIDVLEDLGLPDAEDILESYPHELSGGMAQRVLIALALACEPDLILADEPTTALDVTIQAQILDLFDRIQEEFGTSILLITHNLGVVDQVCDRVNVMYAGKVVESGPTQTVFDDPEHPYTIGLLRALPEQAEGAISLIEGDVPDLRNPPEGCRFEPRCPVAKAECETYDPPPTATAADRMVRCIHYETDQPGSVEEIYDEL